MIGLPAGLILLASLPLTWLPLIVSLSLLVTASSVRIFGRWQLRQSKGLMMSAGLLCGLLNGLTASGGLAAAMLMTASGLPTRALRPTMVILLLFAGTYGLLCAALIPSQSGHAMLHSLTWHWVAVLTPTMLLGVHFGRRWYESSAERDHRNFALDLIMLISAMGVARGLAQVLQVH